MQKAKPIILITGANSGIGKATALALAKEDAHVVMLCRSNERGTAAQEEIIKESGNEHVDLQLCDLSSLAAVREFAAKFSRTYERLDVLINNAAIITTKRQETADGFELQFGVNHLAPFLLTNLLLDKLKASAPSRIVNVSSNAYTFGKIHFDDLQSSKKYRVFGAYGQSKLANLLFTEELASRLQGSGVTVNAVHPGAISTNLGIDRNTGFGKPLIKLLKPFFKTPAEGAQTSVYLATSPEVEGVNGKFFIDQKEAKIKGSANDPDTAKRLWAISEKLTELD